MQDILDNEIHNLIALIHNFNYLVEMWMDLDEEEQFGFANDIEVQNTIENLVAIFRKLEYMKDRPPTDYLDVAAILDSYLGTEDIEDCFSFSDNDEISELVSFYAQ